MLPRLPSFPGVEHCVRVRATALQRATHRDSRPRDSHSIFPHLTLQKTQGPVVPISASLAGCFLGCTAAWPPTQFPCGLERVRTVNKAPPPPPIYSRRQDLIQWNNMSLPRRLTPSLPAALGKSSDKGRLRWPPRHAATLTPLTTLTPFTHSSLSPRPVPSYGKGDKCVYLKGKSCKDGRRRGAARGGARGAGVVRGRRCGPRVPRR